MRIRFYGLSAATRWVLAASLVVGGTVGYAKDKKVKIPPAPPKDEIEVVGHIPLTGSPVTRFSSTQHYSSYYLYAEHGASTNLTLIDVTKVNQPAVLADVANAAGTGSQSLLAVAGTAALVDAPAQPASGAAAAPESQTIKIMDFSDPEHPKVAREFTGVTAIGRNDPRGLIYVANAEGIWILRQHLAEDPEVEKAYANYVMYSH